MEKNTDYRKACFELVDRLNEGWRAKYNGGDTEYEYTLEFFREHAEGTDMYKTQITYMDPCFGFCWLIAVMSFNQDSCFQKLIEKYLAHVNGDDFSDRLVKAKLTGIEYPKTIDEILKS